MADRRDRDGESRDDAGDEGTDWLLSQLGGQDERDEQHSDEQHSDEQHSDDAPSVPEAPETTPTPVQAAPVEAPVAREVPPAPRVPAAPWIPLAPPIPAAAEAPATADATPAAPEDESATVSTPVVSPPPEPADDVNDFFRPSLPIPLPGEIIPTAPTTPIAPSPVSAAAAPNDPGTPLIPVDLPGAQDAIPGLGGANPDRDEIPAPFAWELSPTAELDPLVHPLDDAEPPAPTGSEPDERADGTPHLTDFFPTTAVADGTAVETDGFRNDTAVYLRPGDADDTRSDQPGAVSVTPGESPAVIPELIDEPDDEADASDDEADEAPTMTDTFAALFVETGEVPAQSPEPGGAPAADPAPPAAVDPAPPTSARETITSGWPALDDDPGGSPLAGLARDTTLTGWEPPVPPVPPAPPAAVEPGAPESPNADEWNEETVLSAPVAPASPVEPPAHAPVDTPEQALLAGIDPSEATGPTGKFSPRRAARIAAELAAAQAAAGADAGDRAEGEQLEDTPTDGVDEETGPSVPAPTEADQDPGAEPDSGAEPDPGADTDAGADEIDDADGDDGALAEQDALRTLFAPTAAVAVTEAATPADASAVPDAATSPFAALPSTETSAPLPPHVFTGPESPAPETVAPGYVPPVPPSTDGGSGSGSSDGGGGARFWNSPRTNRILLWTAIGVGAVLLIIGLFALGTRLPSMLGTAATPTPTPTRTATPTPTPTPTPTATATGPQPAGKHAWNTLRGGECLQPYTNPWELTFTVVDCGGSHAAQMVYTGVFSSDPAAAYPGASQLSSQINLLCSRPGILNTDAAGAYQDIQIAGSYPVTAAQWNGGQRSYYCFVNRSSNGPITGSLAGPGPS